MSTALLNQQIAINICYVNHSLKWKRGGREERIDQRRQIHTSVWDVKNRQKENWATEEPMG